MSPADVSEWAETLVKIGAAISAGICAIRLPWKRSEPVKAIEQAAIAQLDTRVAVQLIEHEKDDHYGRVVSLLEQLVDARDKQYTALLDINARNAELHSAALKALDAERQLDRNTIVNMRDEIWEIRDHKERCESHLAALQKSVDTIERTHQAALRGKDNRYHELARKFQENGGTFTLSDVERSSRP